MVWFDSLLAPTPDVPSKKVPPPHARVITARNLDGP